MIEKLKNKINLLQVGEDFKFTYRKKEYTFSCYDSYEGVKKYAVSRISSMNVGKVTDKYLSLYGYDMMLKRTAYKMSIEEIII